ncbi:hypothetical protein [Photobacterium sp. GB-72]|uniref:hypothetical protein n=1 Tax=Photobacterium sp. GB-72 TaxID=2022105 RepID=UPI000D15E58D|nr:hypothetical protein [Photobacterium sp. GB-72]PSV28083.1 hypothetical protein C9J40_19580 [Photobacterium sp. GB-72]
MTVISFPPRTEVNSELLKVVKNNSGYHIIDDNENVISSLIFDNDCRKESGLSLYFSLYGEFICDENKLDIENEPLIIQRLIQLTNVHSSISFPF